MSIKHTATFTEEEVAEALTYYLAQRENLRAVSKYTFTITRGYSGDIRESGTPDRVSVSVDVQAIPPGSPPR